LSSVSGALFYFTYLVEQKEINDKSVLDFYRAGILKELNEVDKYYATLDTRLLNPNPHSKYTSNHIVILRKKVLLSKKVWEHKSSSNRSELR
jgi:hypothetical protein